MKRIVSLLGVAFLFFTQTFLIEKTYAEANEKSYKNFYGIAGSAKPEEDIKYAKQMGYDYIVINPSFTAKDYHNIPDCTGLKFYLIDPHFYPQVLSGYNRNIDTTKPLSDRAKNFYNQRMAWKSYDPFPNNLATGYHPFSTSTKFSIMWDFQQQAVLDEVVENIIRLAKSYENPSLSFTFGGYIITEPKLAGEFYRVDDNGNNIPVTLSYWTSGDSSLVHDTITHEYATYSEAMAAFYKKLSARMAQEFTNPKWIVQPTWLYNEVDNNEWIYQIKNRSDKNELTPDMLSQKSPQNTNYVDDDNNFNSGVNITKNAVSNSHSGDFTEYKNRLLAAKSGINGAWYNWLGRFGGTGDMPDFQSITEVNARLKLIRCLPNWDNLNNVPLADRSWDGSIYQSTKSYASSNVIYSRHPKTGKLFAVFLTKDGTIKLNDGEIVASVQRTDGLFVESGDGSADVVIAGNEIRLKSGDNIDKGYIFTLSSSQDVAQLTVKKRSKTNTKPNSETLNSIGNAKASANKGVAMKKISSQSSPSSSSKLSSTSSSIYIDPSSTDPTQDGTQAHPYHSWKDIPNNNPTRIATFYFKRGTRLVWPVTIYNPNTTATNYITIDAYGAGPNRLNFSGSSWTNEGNGVYSRVVGSSDKNVHAFYINGTERQEDYFFGYFARKGYSNIKPRASKWLYNPNNDKIYFNSDIGDPNNAAASQWGATTDKPKIIGRIPITGSWTSVGGGIYSHTLQYNYPQVFFDGDPEASTEIPYSTAGSSPPAGYWSSVNNTIYYHPSSGNAPSQSQYACYYNVTNPDATSIYMSGMRVEKAQYTLVKNLNFTFGAREGYDSGWTNNVTMQNCLIYMNGHCFNEAAGNQPQGIGSGVHFSGSSITVQDSESSSNHDGGFDLEAQGGSTDLMAATYSNIWAHHNGEWGCSVHGSSTNLATISITNGIIERSGNSALVLNNIVKGSPGYGRAGIGFIYGQGTFDKTIFDSSNGAAMQWPANLGNVTARYCLFVNNNYDNNAVGTYYASSLAYANTSSATSFQVTLYNNTFYEPNAENIYQKWSSDYFPAVKAKNNIFISGNGINNIEGQANPANNPYAIFDSNNFGKGTFSNSVAGTNITDINTWNSKSYVSTDLTTNPLFANEANKILTLQSQSPMINAGVNVGLSSDILGNPISGNPDIGAFEYQSVSNTNDITPPTIAITSPTSDATYTTSQSTINLSGTASDNVGVSTVTWSNSTGGSGTAGGTTNWSISNIALSSGDNVITVTAKDAAGNSSTDTITVTYNTSDSTNPSVTITSPTSNSTYTTTQSTINLGGTASDNVGVSTVTWSNNKGGSGTANGTTNWSISNIALSSGDNVITVTAKDGSNNTGTDTITVTYSVTNTTSTNGPKALYALDEGSGTVADDSSGSGNNGTINGATWTKGKNGSGLSFDGTSDYVQAPESSSLDISGNAITLSCWVNYSNTGVDQIYIAKPYNANSHPSPYFSYSLHGLFVSTNQYRPRFWLSIGGTGKVVTSSTLISPGLWYYIAGTYDGSTMKIYVNGVEQGSLSVSGNITSYATPLRLGTNGGFTEYFKGVLDEVRIYDRALSIQEIQDLYTGDLKALYAFDEGSGTIAADSSGNGNNGTINGATWTTGKNGSGLSFDGTSDYVQAPESSSLDIDGSAISLSCWVNYGDTGVDQIYIAKPYNANSHLSPYFSYSLHGLFVSTNQYRPSFWLSIGGTGKVVASSALISPGQWYHITGVYDGSTMKIYVNGVEQGSLSVSGNITPYATPLRLGTNGGFTEYFKGILDDVRIYDQALSSQEVQGLYNLKMQGPVVSQNRAMSNQELPENQTQRNL